MSFANTYTQRLRKIARSYVLPAQEICDILDSRLDFSSLRTIADFGAGTLFFSEYFASRLNRSNDSVLESIGGGQHEADLACKLESPQKPTPQGQVVAIDSIYTTLTPTTTYPNITLEPDLFHALAHYTFDCFFASDVLHHLSKDFTQTLLESIAHIPTIIIKDIDGAHRFGSFMNATHDLVFNHEKVRMIYPTKLESTLADFGFTCSYYYLPKLWYPHFLLIATRRASDTQAQ